jgi:hypothetical protein
MKSNPSFLSLICLVSLFISVTYEFNANAKLISLGPDRSCASYYYDRLKKDFRSGIAGGQSLSLGLTGSGLLGGEITFLSLALFTSLGLTIAAPIAGAVVIASALPPCAYILYKAHEEMHLLRAIREAYRVKALGYDPIRRLSDEDRKLYKKNKARLLLMSKAPKWFWELYGRVEEQKGQDSFNDLYKEFSMNIINIKDPSFPIPFVTPEKFASIIVAADYDKLLCDEKRIQSNKRRFHLYSKKKALSVVLEELIHPREVSAENRLKFVGQLN